MKVLDLFAGIGGFSLGLERAGFETIAFCEIDSYCQKVLRKHWPDIPIYEDIKELTADRLKSDGIIPDCLTGGFPCQDLSVAGKQAGIKGERSGLWGEYARLIGDVRPRYAIVENVPALLSGDNGGWFGRVLGDLAALGYDAEWHCIPASAIGAPHRRDRVWIIATTRHDTDTAGEFKRRETKSGITLESGKICERIQQGWDYVADTNGKRRQNKSERYAEVRQFIGRSSIEAESNQWGTEPDVGRVAHGVPRRMDRLKCLGNAIIPQIAEMIGRAINDTDRF